MITTFFWKRLLFHTGVGLVGLSLMIFLSACLSTSTDASIVTQTNVGSHANFVRATTNITENVRLAHGPHVLYMFNEGKGSTVFDTSRVEPALNLTIHPPDAVRWMENGLAITAPVTLLSTKAATKFNQAVLATNELSIEAWVKPANTTQDGPARILTISEGSLNRNVTLGQGLWGDMPSSLYVTRLRTTATNNNGVPSLSTPSNSLQAELSHVVYTRDTAGVARIYINGVEQAGTFIGGDLSNWNMDYHLALANEITDERPWLGEMHLIALYNRVLATEEIERHFQYGADGTLQRSMPKPTTLPAPAYPLTMATVPTETVNQQLSVPSAVSYFPLGVFEDSGMVGGHQETFQKMLNDLKSRGLDSVMFTNNYADRDAPMLTISDNMDMHVFFLPAGDFNESWWKSEIPATIARARQAAEPVVNQLHMHPSFKGYIVKDEPGRRDMKKVALMTQALQELDTNRPATPILIGTDRVGPIFEAARPEVMLIDVYPAGYHNPIGDFTLTGFGYNHLDFVSYIREVTQKKPPTTPLWIILQTHKFGDGGRFSLREPVPAEVRAQNWLAIGEGAKGIFWFIYSSQQGWNGLVDNPILYQEVTSLTLRVAPLRDTLLQLQKGDNVFTITGRGNPYVSTLISHDKTKTYVVAVNMDCENPQELKITSDTLNGKLRDLETTRTYEQGERISFRPGDGHIFEVIREQ
jgi:hypothetical protein